MIREEFIKEFKEFAKFMTMKKKDKQKFEEIQAKYLVYLYVNLRMSQMDILSIYPTTQKIIKQAILKYAPNKFRDNKSAIKYASYKKHLAWKNPNSGYNNYGNNGNINQKNAEKRHLHEKAKAYFERTESIIK